MWEFRHQFTMQTTKKKHLFSATVAPFSNPNPPRPSTRQTWNGSPPQRSGKKRAGKPLLCVMGKKTPGNRFGNLFWLHKKMPLWCHGFEILFQKNKRFLFGLKSKIRRPIQLQVVSFCLEKSRLLQTHSTHCGSSWGSFQKHLTVADVRMIYG